MTCQTMSQSFVLNELFCKLSD